MTTTEIPEATIKTLDLPKPIAEFFVADAGDAEAVAQCFLENAIVEDEGQTYLGRAAIKQWKADASKKFQYTSSPFAVEKQPEKTVVSSHLEGNFPGSPVDLRFFFEVQGDKIKSLEIIP
jgi:hypothetical protein